MNRRAAAAALVVGALSLPGCGGGGNESGPPDTLFASPSEFAVGTPTACYQGLGPTVHVYGGQPPYKLKNSAPEWMTIDKDRLSYSGEGFTFSFSGDCIASLPVTIEDDMGRVTEVKVTNSIQ